MSTIKTHRIEQFYDDEVYRKIRDYVEGNKRVECAWQTILEWAPVPLGRVLEIGCGIGANAWRMSQEWPNAKITGLDLSPQSVKIANNLFASESLTFQQGSFESLLFEGKFDLIVMMDVYEHIEVEKRERLHYMLSNRLAESGRLVLTFPTKFHQSWLKENAPDELQPIDEIVEVTALMKLSEDIGREFLLYKKVDVWRQGDYAHAVLGNKCWLGKPERNDRNRDRVESGRQLLMELGQRISARLFFKRAKNDERNRRASMVEERLGAGFYSVGTDY